VRECRDYALERLRRCPQAVEMLGDGIDGKRAGWACGNGEIQGGMERASWSIPVRGKKASGRYEYSYDRFEGSVRFAGRLEVDGRSLDMTQCH
jgi:hypothetical protein